MIRLRTDDVAWQAVDDEIICLDLRNSRYLAVNRTGAELWPLLVDGADIEALVSRLMDVFGVGSEQAAADVDAFVGELSSRALLAEP